MAYYKKGHKDRNDENIRRDADGKSGMPFGSGQKPALGRAAARGAGKGAGRATGRATVRDEGRNRAGDAGRGTARDAAKDAVSDTARDIGRNAGRNTRRDAGRDDEDMIFNAAAGAADAEDRIEGRNPVLEALKSGRSINKIFVARGDREGSIKQIIALARERGVVVQEVDRTRLEALSTTRVHQGVIAFASPKDYVEWEDIVRTAEEKGEKPFIIILDEIADPHNLGSILRTADAVGAHGVIIPKRRAVGLNATVSKASAGAVEYVPVARVTNIAQTIESLKKSNIWVVGTDQTGEQAFYDADLNIPLALVIGSEGEGMGKLVREKCDYVVNIPMQGSISSLNASVAAAIVMYEISRQRSR